MIKRMRQTDFLLRNVQEGSSYMLSNWGWKNGTKDFLNGQKETDFCNTLMTEPNNQRAS
jgi:hypothetical protein